MFNNWGSELNGFAYSEILGNSKDISNKSRFDLAKKRINYPYIIEDKSTKKQYNIIKNNIMANGDSSEDLTKCMLEERKVNLFIEELDYFTGKFVLLYFEKKQYVLLEVSFIVLWDNDFGVYFLEEKSNIKFNIENDELYFI
ncbi:hypothetical protein [Arcobacter vandammei]|uniref:hypothetical protein n=1 Tax=Arcobacter vandammei TaxID=2782243 RepID=UPI0018DF18F0|nr:hypothetical protein [Arcobacter vandammei]